MIKHPHSLYYWNVKCATRSLTNYTELHFDLDHYRKKLNKGPLLHIHLNLCFSLSLALIVFIAGIETATPIPVSASCAVPIPVCNCIFHHHVFVCMRIVEIVFQVLCVLFPFVQWLCGVVAGLLHYFFLSVFCWMLAEGIMLYFLLIRVFGSSVERWYLFLSIGWGKPTYILSASIV